MREAAPTRRRLTRIGVWTAGIAGLAGTAAVGGLHAAGARRSRAVGAVLLVQASYAGGAVVGLGIADALPASARVSAIAGGALFIVGASETERSIGARRPATA
jgi:hypothetical protein